VKEIVHGAKTGNNDCKEEGGDGRVSTTLPYPRRANRDERQIRYDVPKMRNAEDRPLIGELVIVLILGYRRQQQQAEHRRDHHTDEDENATIAVHGAGHHLNTIAKAAAKVRTRCTLLPSH